MVQFADFEPLIEGRAGHPQGLEWFCNEHVQAAQALAASTTGEALSKLRGRYGVFPPYESKPYRDPELWVTDVGPNAPQVFAMLRKRPLQRPRSCWQARFSKSHKAGPVHFKGGKAPS